MQQNTLLAKNNTTRLSNSIENAITFLSDNTLPAVLSAENINLTLDQLLEQQYDELQKLTLQYGAVLLRGFPLKNAADFSEFIRKFYRGEEAFSQTGLAAARRKIDTLVSEATTLASHVMLPMHNEMAYQNRHPRELVFFCETPAAQGGQTPIADMRQVKKALSPDDVAELKEKGVTYHRYFPNEVLPGHSPMFKTWRNTFLTNDRVEVERLCQESGATVRWDAKDGLHIIAQLEVIKQHPLSGDETIFASGLRTSCDLENWQQQMLEPTDASYLPLLIQLGDGTAISDSLTHTFMQNAKD